MPRRRIAIAHFVNSTAALHTRAAVIALGGNATTFFADTPAVQGDAFCRLEVALPPILERRLLHVLLGSEATLVDIHDA